VRPERDEARSPRAHGHAESSSPQLSLSYRSSRKTPRNTRTRVHDLPRTPVVWRDGTPRHRPCSHREHKPSSAFFWRMYCRAVTSATSRSCVSLTMRCQIRCAVWCCLRLTVGFQNAVDERSQRPHHRLFALDRLAFRRSRAGQHLPHHPPLYSQVDGDPLMVSTPNSYSLRICSKSSAFALLCIPASCLSRQNAIDQNGGWANLEHRSGPIQSIEIMLFP
jgi:hypothetical protein